MVIPEPYTMEEAGHWLAAAAAEYKSECARTFVRLPLIGRWFDAYAARQYVRAVWHTMQAEGLRSMMLDGPAWEERLERMRRVWNEAP